MESAGASGGAKQNLGRILNDPALSSDDLDAIAEQTGFQPEPLEKTIWLLRILQELAAHESLRGCFALTGGTALRLFHMPFPSRLSEDIDLQWRKPDSSGTAVQRMRAVLQQVCQQNGLALSRWRNPLRATSYLLTAVAAGAAGAMRGHRPARRCDCSGLPVTLVRRIPHRPVQ